MRRPQAFYAVYCPDTERRLGAFDAIIPETGRVITYTSLVPDPQFKALPGEVSAEFIDRGTQILLRTPKDFVSKDYVNVQLDALDAETYGRVVDVLGQYNLKRRGMRPCLPSFLL